MKMPTRRGEKMDPVIFESKDEEKEALKIAAEKKISLLRAALELTKKESIKEKTRKKVV